jgi:hypothetical protein
MYIKIFCDAMYGDRHNCWSETRKFQMLWFLTIIHNFHFTCVWFITRYTYIHTHTHHTVLFCWEGPRTYQSQTIWRWVKWRYCNILTPNIVHLFSVQHSHCSVESKIPYSNLHLSKQCWWLVLLTAACSRVPTFVALLKILIWLDFTQHSWWVPLPLTSSKYNI